MPASTHPRIHKAIDIVIGERYFFPRRTEACREHFARLLAGKLKNSDRAGIEYRFAQMAEAEGDPTAAEPHWRKGLKPVETHGSREQRVGSWNPRWHERFPAGMNNAGAAGPKLILSRRIISEYPVLLATF